MNINLFFGGEKSNCALMKNILFKSYDNLKIKTYNLNNILNLSNSKVLIIKQFNKFQVNVKKTDEELIEIVKLLKKNNNYIYYEPIDYNWKIENFKKYFKKMLIFNYVDEIILSSKSLISEFNNYLPNKKLHFNYHEFDDRYKINYKEKIDSVNYIGDLNKSSLTEDILKEHSINYIKSSSNENLLKNIYNPSIHIDYIKQDKLYYYLHTSTKLSTAMYFKSIFICNRVPIYVELLGIDYEYYLEDDLSNIKFIINKAKKTINNDIEYNKYINNNNKLLKLLCRENILNNYIDIYNNE